MSSNLTKIQNLRHGRDLKALELARLAKVPASTLSSIEHRRLVPNTRTRENIAAVLRVPVSELFSESGLAR
jgi:DNA-binding XRE family transcriptional regulator